MKALFYDRKRLCNNYVDNLHPVMSARDHGVVWTTAPSTVHSEREYLVKKDDCSH
jgi:hypothetical protein